MRLENLVVVGLNHVSVTVRGRERAAVPAEELPAALDAVIARAGLSEAVLLSTCSRVEVYAVADEPAAASRRVREWFAERGGDAVAGGLYAKNGLEALRHLFRVTAGLDSWIVGECEIQGQVRRAYHAALERGRTGPALNRAFQSALANGKAVRAGTAIQTGINSIGGAAALLAHRVFPGAKSGRVVVFGSGEAAEAVARHLSAKQFSEIWVANRTLEKARAVAEPLGAAAVTLERGLDALREARAAVFSVGVRAPLLRAAALAPLLAGRTDPLFLIDLGLPRNVEPACGGLGGVHLHGLDELKELVRESMERKGAAKTEAETLSNAAAADCGVELLKSAVPPASTGAGLEAAWNAA